ncbi:4-alpha-glucanotransferase [Streptomyces fradiae]|uniref:4-alpha-glucanotransferase n=1 Tax=Streptomyces fradiae TaxID=1906 RepID=UPI0033C0DFAA
MPTSPLSEDLAELARAHGVDTWYLTEKGHRVDVPARTVVAVLAALDVDAATPEAVAASLAAHRRLTATRLLPACVISRPAVPAPLDLPEGAEARVVLEDGATRAISGRRVPADLPLGYHRLHVRHGARSAEAPLIVVPDRIAGPERREWGFAAHLYSLLSAGSWGMGDLADLADVVRWSAAEGAGFCLVNPLHALLPATFSDHSPYWPSTRRFPDPVHVRITGIPEYGALAGADRAAMAELLERSAALREAALDEGGLIDRDAVWAVKLAALRLLHRVEPSAERHAAYRAFVEREGQDLVDFATWCALAHTHGPDWSTWPEELRDPATARGLERYAEEVEFRRWAAWIADEQFAAVQRAARSAGMAVGVIHDLAVGAHPRGAESWALRRLQAAGVVMGSPPDTFTAQGQNWHLPPWRPDRLAEEGYAPYARLLRGVMRHAGALRLDHAMGLWRQWWIPDGVPIPEGTYVRYDWEAMLGVLLLEAHRAGVAVIGEDLGTVEAGVRERLAERGVLGASVLWLERTGDTGDTGDTGAADRPLPAPLWRENCLAALTNHDLPTTTARLSGAHVEMLHRHGLRDGSVEEYRTAELAQVREWLAALDREGLLPADGPPPGEGWALPPATGREGASSAERGLPPVVAAFHRFLLRTPARLVCVWLPDTVGDLRTQNLPGVRSGYPCWRWPLADSAGRAVPLERLMTAPGAAEVAALLSEGD